MCLLMPAASPESSGCHCLFILYFGPLVILTVAVQTCQLKEIGGGGGGGLKDADLYFKIILII